MDQLFLYEFGQVEALVQGPDDRHPHGHDDKFPGCGGRPSDPERKVESQFQFNGDNEHRDRKYKRVHHHAAPNVSNKPGEPYCHQQSDGCMSDAEDDVKMRDRRKKKIGQKDCDDHAKNIFFVEHDQMIEYFRHPELNLRKSKRLHEHGHGDI